MGSRAKPAILTLAAALCLTPVAAAQSAALDARQAAFLSTLQSAARANDRAAFVALARFPLTVAIAGLRVPIADAPDFLDRYDDIVTPELRDEIARASTQPGSDVQITREPDGFRIGTNTVSVSDINGELRISGIAVPPARPDTTAGAAAEADAGGTPRARSREAPRRLGIRAGPRPTQWGGYLQSGATDFYLVHVPKGQRLSVRLERAPAGTATIRVLHARTGAPLNPRASPEARVVAGRSVEGGDYRIEVQRIQDDDRGALAYSLSLTLR